MFLAEALLQVCIKWPVDLSRISRIPKCILLRRLGEHRQWDRDFGEDMRFGVCGVLFTGGA